MTSTLAGLRGLQGHVSVFHQNEIKHASLTCDSSFLVIHEQFGEPARRAVELTQEVWSRVC